MLTHIMKLGCSSFSQSFVKEYILQNLLLVRSDKLGSLLAKVFTDEGLIYEQPTVEIVKTVMIQMREVLADTKSLTALELKVPDSEDVADKTVIQTTTAEKIGNKTKPSRVRNLEPSRPLSIRNICRLQVLPPEL